jgi:uncharacterized membrane protein
MDKHFIQKNFQMIYIILLLGTFIRLININQSYWLDEAIGVMAAKNYSVMEIINRFSPGNFHPPLHFIVLKGWGNVFGFSEISTRSLSLIWALLTIFIVYQVCLFIKPKRVDFAWFSSLLLAVNPLHVYYSQDAWVYSFVTFIASASAYQYLKFAKSKNVRDLIILTFCFIIGLYTYYPLVFLILGLFVHSYVNQIERKKILISVFIAILSFIPWVPIFATQLKVASVARATSPIWWSVLGKGSIKAAALVWIKFIIGRISFYTKKGYIAYVFVTSIIPAFSLLKSWAYRREVGLVWYWLIFPFVSALIGGILGSGFVYFRLIFILPAFCILISYAVSLMQKSFSNLSKFALVISSLTSIILFNSNPRFHRENWKGAVKHIESNSVPGKSATLIISANQGDPYKFYSKSIPLITEEDLSREGLTHIWLLRYVQPIFDPQDNLRKQIETAGFKKANELDFNSIVIWEYKKL